MIKHSIKILSSIALTVFSLQTFAASNIQVTVNTNEKTAAGIGFSVDGKKLGRAGKSFTGKGPKNKTYLFGYRKDSVNGTNIPCGSLTLTKDSNVTLVTKGNKCRSVVN